AMTFEWFCCAHMHHEVLWRLIRSDDARFRFSLFFFSSRRRHTSSKRDWSSDVCSSDLGLASQPLERSPTIVRRTIRSFGDTFSPGIFSAQSHSTSVLLRTL